MRNSTNFNLNLVEGSDIVNPLVQDVPNYEKIDEQMFKNQNAGIQIATELKSGTVHAITRSTPDAPMFRFTATSNWVSGDTMTVDGVQVNVLTTSGETLATGAYVINSTVMGVLVGNLVTLFVQSVSIAEDAQKLGGELPSYYATKAELDNVKNTADASGQLANENNTAISNLDTKTSTIFAHKYYSFEELNARGNLAGGANKTITVTFDVPNYRWLCVKGVWLYNQNELVVSSIHITSNNNQCVIVIRNTGSTTRYVDGQLEVVFARNDTITSL